MRGKVALIMVALALLGGCATSFHRGVVAMKVDESTAHVGLNSDEVKVGDHVELYGSKCTTGTRGSPSKCIKISKGHGTVVEILSEHYVSVKFDQGVSFQEGDFIEKHNHKN